DLFIKMINYMEKVFMAINEKFVQEISSINYNNSIFSLYFVGQDPHKIAQGIMPEKDEELALK
ncbi:TPA: hypothetical protein ACWYFI_003640, partial [Proteus mirabilis]